MPSFRCLSCAEAPAAPADDLFALVDAQGRHWVCSKEEDPKALAESLGTSEWAWGYYYIGVAGRFAPYCGAAAISDPYGETGRILDRLLSVEAADEAALAVALAGKPLR